MPTPKPDEDRDAFISRCIAQQKRERPSMSDEQAAAICHSMWREAKLAKTVDEVWGRDR